MKASTWSRSRAVVFGVVCLLAAWQAASIYLGSALILPGPGTTFREVYHLLRKADTWRHLGATVARGLLGFVISYLAALVLGFASGLRRDLSAFFRPLVTLTRSMPTIAVILLALIWFRTDAVPVFVTFLVVFPLAAENVTHGVLSVDRQLLQMAHLYGVRKYRLVKDLYLPAMAPHLVAAAAAGLGLAWKATVAAEVLSYPHWSVGSQLDTARVQLETTEMFAWTVLVVALGFLFDALLGLWLRANRSVGTTPFGKAEDASSGESRHIKQITEKP